MKPIRRISLALYLLVVLAVAMVPARAGEIIDQVNNGFKPTLFDSIQLLGPIGQSFTPTLTSLNFFDVFTDDFSHTTGAALEIEIFSGILDNLLGTSLPTVLPVNFRGPTFFDFASPVPLVPGNLFSAQVIVTSRSNWGLGSSGGPVSTYPGGDWIIQGMAEPGNDLWFQEGIIIPEIPEPSTLLLLGSGLVGLAWSTRRRLWN